MLVVEARYFKIECENGEIVGVSHAILSTPSPLDAITFLILEHCREWNAVKEPRILLLLRDAGTFDI